MAPGGVLIPGDQDLSTVRMRFTSNPEEITDAVASPGRRLACAADPLQATRTLTEAVGQIRAARNIVFLCQSPDDTFPPAMLDLIHMAEVANIGIHVISCSPDSVMNELCSRTRGMLLAPVSPDEIPEAMEIICASLLNSYEVRYRPENPGAARMRLQVFTDTLMGEGSQALV